MLLKDPNCKLISSQENFTVIELGEDDRRVPETIRHFKGGFEEFRIESWSLTQTSMKDVFKKVLQI